MEPKILLDPEVLRAESLEKIKSFFETKQYTLVKKELLEYNAADIAEILEELLDDDDLFEKVIVSFRLLPKDISSDVFSFMSPAYQLKIVDGITEKELVEIVKDLDFDDRIDILEELPANLVDKLLAKAPKEERKLMNVFLNYPDNSAGSLMTPEYVSLKKSMTVRQALDHIREIGKDAETIYTCYVKDEKRILIGIISLSTLVVSPEDAIIEDLMHTDYVWINVYDDQEEVAEQFKKYDFLAMPVVDKENRIVGIITVDDIIDVIEEENTEDFERMGGVIDISDSDIDYLNRPVWQDVKARVPWLAVMMVSAMITGAIISHFETVLSQMIILVSYIPLLMGTGGNSGTQASTLMVRGLALGEVEPSDTLRVLWKEIRVSISVGLILSVINFLKIIIIDGETILVAITVSLSLLIIIAFAKALGSMVPILAKVIGADPALMANPIISSLTDMVSVLVYFLMAAAILGL